MWLQLLKVKGVVEVIIYCTCTTEEKKRQKVIHSCTKDGFCAQGGPSCECPEKEEILQNQAVLSHLVNNIGRVFFSHGPTATGFIFVLKICSHEETSRKCRGKNRRSEIFDVFYADKVTL